MSARGYKPADAPTLYFIGVTTAQSSIMNIFPRWADLIGLSNARIEGVDFALDAEPVAYREAVAFIKEDPLSKGALVTTHKLELLRASRDLFDALDEYAELLCEVSCISKRDGQLIGHAKDAVTARLALDAFLPEEYWQRSNADAFFLGAGGATVALTTSLLSAHADDRPTRLLVSDINSVRIEEIKKVHDKVDHDCNVEYSVVEGASDNDELLASLPPRSLVVNGTGMGKDLPGSPLTDAASFPEMGYAWDYNYRGDFTFLKQAERCECGVTTVDGWVYFIHGWTRVVAEVFDVTIPTEGPRFDELARVAANERRP